MERTYVVTGAVSGIGAAVAKYLQTVFGLNAARFPVTNGNVMDHSIE